MCLVIASQGIHACQSAKSMTNMTRHGLPMAIVSASESAECILARCLIHFASFLLLASVGCTATVTAPVHSPSPCKKANIRGGWTSFDHWLAFLHVPQPAPEPPFDACAVIPCESCVRTSCPTAAFWVPPSWAKRVPLPLPRTWIFLPQLNNIKLVRAHSCKAATLCAQADLILYHNRSSHRLPDPKGTLHRNPRQTPASNHTPFLLSALNPRGFSLLTPFGQPYRFDQEITPSRGLPLLKVDNPQRSLLDKDVFRRCWE